MARESTQQQEAVPVVAPRVSLEAEVPEALFEGMRAFLEGRPEWDQYRVITSALASFLARIGACPSTISTVSSCIPVSEHKKAGVPRSRLWFLPCPTC
jgi:hypothetical protein